MLLGSPHSHNSFCRVEEIWVWKYIGKTLVKWLEIPVYSCAMVHLLCSVIPSSCAGVSKKNVSVDTSSCQRETLATRNLVLQWRHMGKWLELWNLWVVCSRVWRTLSTLYQPNNGRSVSKSGIRGNMERGRRTAPVMVLRNDHRQLMTDNSWLEKSSLYPSSQSMRTLPHSSSSLSESKKDSPLSGSESTLLGPHCGNMWSKSKSATLALTCHKVTRSPLRLEDTDTRPHKRILIHWIKSICISQLATHGHLTFTMTQTNANRASQTAHKLIPHILWSRPCPQQSTRCSTHNPINHHTHQLHNNKIIVMTLFR